VATVTSGLRVLNDTLQLLVHQRQRQARDGIFSSETEQDRPRLSSVQRYDEEINMEWINNLCYEIQITFPLLVSHFYQLIVPLPTAPLIGGHGTDAMARSYAARIETVLRQHTNNPQTRELIESQLDAVLEVHWGTHSHRAHDPLIREIHRLIIEGDERAALRRAAMDRGEIPSTPLMPMPSGLTDPPRAAWVEEIMGFGRDFDQMLRRFRPPPELRELRERRGGGPNALQRPTARHDRDQRADDTATQRGSRNVGTASRTEDVASTRSTRTTSRDRSTPPSAATAAPGGGISAELSSRDGGSRSRTPLPIEAIEQLSLQSDLGFDQAVEVLTGSRPRTITRGDVFTGNTPLLRGGRSAESGRRGGRGIQGRGPNVPSTPSGLGAPQQGNPPGSGISNGHGSSADNRSSNGHGSSADNRSSNGHGNSAGSGSSNGHGATRRRGGGGDGGGSGRS
jgi:hypothetical protein